MGKTLSQLGDILLKSLPTFFLVISLYVYLRKMFFQPLGKVLAARRDATEGARAQAEAMFRLAEQRAAEYEAALVTARAEIYREQDAERQKALEAQAARIHEARAKADAQLREARQGITEDVAAAKQALGVQVEAMSEQVVQVVLAQ